MTALPLSEFSHHHGPGRPDRASRVTAGLLTGGLYALVTLLAWLTAAGKTMPAQHMEITATLLADKPKREVLTVPPVLAHMVRPHVEKPALPVITMASGPPQVQKPLLALTTAPSPLQGGSAGNGLAGLGASGNGSGGNGSGLSGCFDAAWLRAVTARVSQFFYYPDAALAVHRTGLVTVHFNVRRDGQIDRLRIAKSSGDAELDRAALDIVQKAAPLPPIPDRMQTDRVEGDLPINFGVRGFRGNATSGTCGS